MITREEAFAWMNKQIEAMSMMDEKLEDDGDDIENILWHAYGVHTYNVAKLARIIGYPCIRSYHTDETDKLHFRYRGVDFFAITYEKRIGKKVSA